MELMPYFVINKLTINTILIYNYINNSIKDYLTREIEKMKNYKLNITTRTPRRVRNARLRALKYCFYTTGLIAPLVLALHIVILGGAS